MDERQEREKYEGMTKQAIGNSVRFGFTPEWMPTTFAAPDWKSSRCLYVPLRQRGTLPATLTVHVTEANGSEGVQSVKVQCDAKSKPSNPTPD
jgi:hypothetical protein